MYKILFLGQIGPGQTSLMRMRALARLGHVVRGVNTIEPWTRVNWIQRQVQRQLECGSVVNETNRLVVNAAREFRPDLVWAEKQEFLRAGTLDALHEFGAKLVHFTPDPYFTVAWKRTRIMDAALPVFDVLVYCKAYERQAYEAAGKPIVYMPLGFCDEIHRPRPSGDPRWGCAVGFLGGWEPRRERLLHAIAVTGADVKIWGGYWDFLCDGRWTPRRHLILHQLARGETYRFHRDEALARAYQGGEVYASDYARVLTGAKISLGFLRQIWPDQHTTRTFEIPACGSMLLADRTDEHQEFFEEGEEAEYFASAEELLDKVKFYLHNDVARERITKGGYRRCISGHYAYIHRLAAALDAIRPLLGSDRRHCAPQRWSGSSFRMQGISRSVGASSGWSMRYGHGWLVIGVRNG
jgi:spore maturation protein CgeB